MRNYYVAGPMRGRPLFNFPAFDEGARRLEAEGNLVFNPAARDRAEGFDETGTTGLEDLASLGFNHRQAMADDLQWIALHADAVYMLSGWQTSKGAVAERALALALGLEIRYESDEDARTLKETIRYGR